MTLTTYERGDSFEVKVEWKSGSTYVDSQNGSYLTIYRPDGTKLLNNVSGIRLSTGIYHYYPSTSSDAQMGIYIVDWYGKFYYDSKFGWLPNYQRECVHITNVVQT